MSSVRSARKKKPMGGSGLGRPATAETALRVSELWMKSIFRSVDEAILVVEPDRTIRDVNAAAEKVFGYSKHELAGRSTEVLHVDHEHYRVFGDRIREAFGRGRSARFEFTARRKSGEVFPTEHVVSLLKDPAGNAIGIASIIRDLTERERVAEKLRQYSRALQTVREDEKKMVAAALHHEVGSVAVGMNAYLDAVEQDLRAGESREAFKPLKAARKLFDETVVRLKRLAVDLRPPDLDILGLSAALRQHFARVTEQTGIRIRFAERLGRRRLPVAITTTLFRSVQEAVTNAVKHGEAKRIDVWLSASREDVSLEVRSDGRSSNPYPAGQAKTPRLGLLMMEEMATSAGGTFSTGRGRKKGMTVRVVLPLGGGGGAKEG